MMMPDPIQLDDKSDRDILVILATQMNGLYAAVLARDKYVEERLHSGNKRFEGIDEKLTRFDERWKLSQKAGSQEPGAKCARVGLTRKQALSWSGILICLGSIIGGAVSMVLERITPTPPP